MGIATRQRSHITRTDTPIRRKHSQFRTHHIGMYTVPSLTECRSRAGHFNVIGGLVGIGRYLQIRTFRQIAGDAAQGGRPLIGAAIHIHSTHRGIGRLP